VSNYISKQYIGCLIKQESFCLILKKKELKEIKIGGGLVMGGIYPEETTQDERNILINYFENMSDTITGYAALRASRILDFGTNFQEALVLKNASFRALLLALKVMIYVLLKKEDINAKNIPKDAPVVELKKDDLNIANRFFEKHSAYHMVYCFITENALDDNDKAFKQIANNLITTGIAIMIIRKLRKNTSEVSQYGLPTFPYDFIEGSIGATILKKLKEKISEIINSTDPKGPKTFDNFPKLTDWVENNITNETSISTIDADADAKAHLNYNINTEAKLARQEGASIPIKSVRPVASKLVIGGRSRRINKGKGSITTKKLNKKTKI